MRPAKESRLKKPAFFAFLIHFGGKGKTRWRTENFPLREKVGEGPIFSLGKKTVPPTGVTAFRFPDGHGGKGGGRMLTPSLLPFPWP